uniref:Phospholipase A2 n=1 Tax=Bos indicus x Bos taurus TaxID=30522 RepID=A0A4W2II11_BOBOX
MKTLLLLALIMAFALPALLQVRGNLVDFQKKIKYMTGGEPVTTDGFLDCSCVVVAEDPPKDAMDRCCAVNDCCYKKLKNRRCGTTSLKYNFTLCWGLIVCGKKESYSSTQPHQVCECDQIAILCSARNKKTYNKKLQYYSNRQCKGSTPKCLRSP